MKLSFGLLIALFYSTAVATASTPLTANQQIAVTIDHRDCNRFYVVLDQLSIEVACPTEQYWNSDKQNCGSTCVRVKIGDSTGRQRRSSVPYSLFDIPEVVNQADSQTFGQTKGQVVDTLTPYRSPVIPVTTRPDHIQCPVVRNLGRVPPTYYSHEQDCSKYYECVGGTAVEQHCPPLQFWNQQDKLCGYECIN